MNTAPAYFPFEGGWGMIFEGNSTLTEKKPVKLDPDTFKDICKSPLYKIKGQYQPKTIASKTD